MTTKLDLVIGESALSIVNDDVEYLVVSVDPDSGKLCVYAPLFDDIEWSDSIEDMPSPELEVDVRKPKRKLTRLRALPKPEPEVRTATRKKAEPARKKKATATRNFASDRLTPLEEFQRDQILEMVIESWAQHPNQTKKFTAEESHRIAIEVFGEDTSTNVMRVAGVRAALTRGAYDVTLDELIAGGKAANGRSSAR